MMKRTIIIGAIALGLFAVGCSSENKREQMSDSSGPDTSFTDMDTTGVADTAGRDTMYRNSPATSDGDGNSSPNQ